jgi:N-acetylneuraminic acid mutarotase
MRVRGGPSIHALLTCGFVVSSLVLEACSGTAMRSVAGSVPASSSTPPRVTGAGQAVFHITIPTPSKVTDRSGRRAAYVSSATASFSFTLATASELTASQVSAWGTQTFAVTPGSGACPGSGPWTCTITARFPPGTDTIGVAAYDQSGAQGNVLSRQVATITVTEGSANTQSLALDAQTGSASCASPAIAITSLPSGTSGGECSGTAQGAIALSSAGAVTFPVGIADADGASITAGSPGAPVLSAAQSGGVVTVSVSQNPYQVTLTPAAAGTGTVTLTTSGTSAGDGVTQQSITFSVENPPFWSNVATTLPTAREFLGAGTIGGIIYCVGGLITYYANTNVNEAYNPSTNTWTTEAPMPTTRAGLGVGVVNNILYAIGGFTAGSASYLKTVEAYNPSTNTWSTKASLPTAAYGMGVGVVNGILYTVGGGNSGGTLNKVYGYNPSTNAWTTEAALPMALDEAAVAVVNNTLYVMGGDNGNYLTTVYAYNPTANTWTTEASMPGQGREAVAVGVIGTTIYEAGGDNYNQGYLTTAAAYNATTNTWTTIPSLLEPQDTAASGVVNGVMYVIGGDNGPPVNNVEELTP